MALSFEFVNNCKPGDLLRVKIEDTAEIAILGANEGHGLRALVVLKDNEPPFEIGIGPLFTKVGSLVLADGSKSLVVAAKTGKSLRYFDLTSWKLRGEPGGQRAAFKTWSLWHDGLAQSAPSARLLGYSVE